MHDKDWQIHKNKMSQRGKCILETGLWSDCKFIVRNGLVKKEFKAHKLILSMSSPVFENMFYNELNKSESDIQVDDIEAEAFGAVLNYIYTDEMEIESFDDACDIYYVANKYMIPNLMKQCTSYLLYNVDYTNACEGYELAKLFGEHELLEKCRKIILSEIASIVNHVSFKTIDVFTLKMILGESMLNISELDLFKAAERWIRSEFERREISGNEHLDKQRLLCAEIIPHICFLSMKPEEFAEGPAISNLMTKDETFAILMNLSSPNCSYPMPNGFSKMIRKQPINLGSSPSPQTSKPHQTPEPLHIQSYY